MVQTLADKIIQSGFKEPVLIVLEMYKPLAGIGSAGLSLVAPLLMPIIGQKLYRDAIDFLESPQHIETLISLLEVSCVEGA